MEAIILIGLGISLGSAYAMGYSKLMDIGVHQLLAGNYERAMWVFNILIRLYPTSTDGLINRGVIHSSYYHDYQGAIDDATKVIEKRGKHLAVAYSNRGSAFSQLGNFDKAMKDFDKALELDPEDSSVLEHRVRVLWDHYQDYQAVIDECEEAIEFDPQNYYFYRMAANAFMEMKDFNHALELCQHADKNGLPPARIHILRAVILQKQDGLAEAKTEIDKALVLGPLDPVVVYDLAIIYARSKEYSRAIRSINRLLEPNPKAVELYVWRGSLYSLLGKDAKAIADYSRAVELNPYRGATYNSRASYMAKIGRLDQAIEDANRCIELEPTYKYGYGTRGETYFAMGEYHKALADFEKAEELKMNDEFALMGQVIAHYKLGNQEEVKSLWEQLIEQEPKISDIQHVIDEFDPPQSFVDAVREVASLS